MMASDEGSARLCCRPRTRSGSAVSPAPVAPLAAPHAATMSTARLRDEAGEPTGRRHRRPDAALSRKRHDNDDFHAASVSRRPPDVAIVIGNARKRRALAGDDESADGSGWPPSPAAARGAACGVDDDDSDGECSLLSHLLAKGGKTGVGKLNGKRRKDGAIEDVLCFLPVAKSDARRDRDGASGGVVRECARRSRQSAERHSPDTAGTVASGTGGGGGAVAAAAPAAIPAGHIGARKLDGVDARRIRHSRKGLLANGRRSADDICKNSSGGSSTNSIAKIDSSSNSNSTNIDSSRNSTNIDSSRNSTNIDSSRNRTNMDSSRNSTNMDSSRNSTNIDSSSTNIDSSSTNIDSSRTNIDSSSTNIDSSSTNIDSSRTNIDSSDDRGSIADVPPPLWSGEWPSAARVGAVAAEAEGDGDPVPGGSLGICHGVSGDGDDGGADDDDGVGGVGLMDAAFVETSGRISDSSPSAVPETPEPARKRRRGGLLLHRRRRCRRVSVTRSPNFVPVTPSPILVSRKRRQPLPELSAEPPACSQAPMSHHNPPTTQARRRLGLRCSPSRDVCPRGLAGGVSRASPPASSSSPPSPRCRRPRHSFSDAAPGPSSTGEWVRIPPNFIVINSDDDDEVEGDAVFAQQQVQMDEDEALARALQIQFDEEEAERLAGPGGRGGGGGGGGGGDTEEFWHRPPTRSSNHQEEMPRNQRRRRNPSQHQHRDTYPGWTCCSIPPNFLRAIAMTSMHTQQQSPSNNGDDYEELLRLDEQLGVRAHHLSAADIHRLPTQVFSADLRKPNSQCSICTEAYEEGEVMRTLPCLHAFHAACIDRWLQQSAICPVCRTNIMLD
ncbi:uncharacterized protein LOC144737022 [Lampetra planeri]